MTARWTQRNPRWTWLAAVAILLLLDQSGAVVDFLDFHWRNIHWPAFNLADVFIVCAALTWCLVSLKAPPRQPSRKTPGELRS
jgi:lipoprotein signal peptidase